MPNLIGNYIETISGRRVLIDGELIPATIKIANGKITEVIKNVHLTSDTATASGAHLDAGNLVVMPGIFDSHVHVNEPGRTEWEGYVTATKAALAGGITTIIDMPLNSIPPTTTMENLTVKLNAARRELYTDVGFWGGVIPGNAESLRPMIERGVVGFKCFLIYSGVEEFPCVNEDEVDQALERIKGTGSVLAFHAEMDCGCVPPPGREDPSAYMTFLHSRPDEMELDAIRMVDRMCRKHQDVRCHIVHLSSARAIPILQKLRDDGFPLTVETCPHYLTLKPEEIGRDQTQYKCCPPIREDANQEELWKGLKSGVIDMIVSDHSPCTIDLKEPGKKNFMEAWGGISSVQFGLPIIWSQAESREFSISDLSRWMSQQPARLAGMSEQKGKIDVGFDADIVVWDDDQEFLVTEDTILFRNKISPYVGKTLKGKVDSTILRGKLAFSNGEFAVASGSILVKRNI